LALVLVNYATGPFRESQRRNAATGLGVGGFDRALTLGPWDLDLRFRARNRRILRHARGAGFWLWKPYVVLRALESLDDGDWLFYSDSGSHFVDSVWHLVRFAAARDLDLLVFDAGPFPEGHYTKRDTFQLLDCDRPELAESRQRTAAFSLWRPTPGALTLAREWLAAGCDERAITDLDNQLGLPNYPGWVDHRHDQSIFSLLTKKAGLPAFRNPARGGATSLIDYPDSSYPQVVQHTRARRVAVNTRLRATVVRRAGDLRQGRVTAALRRARLDSLRDEGS